MMRTVQQQPQHRYTTTRDGSCVRGRPFCVGGGRKMEASWGLREGVGGGDHLLCYNSVSNTEKISLADEVSQLRCLLRRDSTLQSALLLKLSR